MPSWIEPLIFTLRAAPGGTVIALADHGAVREVIDPATIPASMAGGHDGALWNALFAVAIAHAMGGSLDQIRHGLFKPGIADRPGRSIPMTAR